MRQFLIDDQNRRHLAKQREFRIAADVIAAAFAKFPEIAAIAVIGSVAKPLWKEVPRFREFRRKGIEVWHECADLDLAVWIGNQDRLGELRRARDLALRAAYEAGKGTSIVGQQTDIFLFEPKSNFYVGRLCHFSQCPKGKRDCLVPGCGAVPFRRVFDGFVPRADILATANQSMLYERGKGILMSALDLPV